MTAPPSVAVPIDRGPPRAPEAVPLSSRAHMAASTAVGGVKMIPSLIKGVPVYLVATTGWYGVGALGLGVAGILYALTRKR